MVQQPSYLSLDITNYIPPSEVVLAITRYFQCTLNLKVAVYSRDTYIYIFDANTEVPDRQDVCFNKGGTVRVHRPHLLLDMRKATVLSRE